MTFPLQFQNNSKPLSSVDHSSKNINQNDEENEEEENALTIELDNGENNSSGDASSADVKDAEMGIRSQRRISGEILLDEDLTLVI